MVEYTYTAWGDPRYTTGSLASTLGAKNHLRYRGYYYDTDIGLYYLMSRYYDPRTGRFINADDTAYIGADGSFASYSLFAYCGNNPVMNVDPSGCFKIPSWTISVAIDGIILALASWLKVTWLSFMAPLKSMGKKAAALYFTKKIAWRVKDISNSLIKIGVKALIWIGKKAYAATFNLSAKTAISAILNEPLRVVTACMSVGGMIAAIWDYFSDKKFDGWIKIR